MKVKRYDDLAYDRDTSYWKEKRPITLEQTELDYISETDSLRAYYSSPEYYHKIDSAFNVVNIWSLLNGVGHRNRVRGTEWYIDGIFEQVKPVWNWRVQTSITRLLAEGT